VIDVFNAVRWYREAAYARYSTRLTDVYSTLTEGTERFMEIYPFMAINTRNYTYPQLEKMLYKYFPGDRIYREKLFQNMGIFKGDPEVIRENFFCGIKVYPPLNFDPWPDHDREKVEKLYEHCIKHRVPLTTHGGGGGFAAIEDEKELNNLTSIRKWQNVLEKFGELTLNIAHFPAEFRNEAGSSKEENRVECERLKVMNDLILTYPNVYTDFSCRAWNDGYYLHLSEVLKGQKNAADRKKLTEHILFGSDFAVCLGAIDSYNHYVHIFSNTGHLTGEEKHAFCCQNPQRFLFG
jgi:predicted TIM-barrel fold metal-dependent hydrolase